eukprot:CAMPEP_0114576900 /NCGR_PEP_ID=MMETSP0125-20121206/1613_1 /TAXON_ID=485358 ORGANISM="Aristerostoma sp., Strain ATCC 50986" /NCGR_SAMPLE_ID=MMETSP0125 /ASSEMBLY_ACC=CAM_ASM_000245 /LENGTH=121 /DNA_ID=CAMNT_0001765779 /DNA_START=889 /DNA_END=1254 /DNA_ORIENTATION=+
MEAVKENGNALEFASKALKANREVVLLAVENKGKAFRFAAQEVNNDKEVAICALKQDFDAIDYCISLLKDREVAKTACETLFKKEDPDKEDIKLILEKNGQALEFLPDEYKKDKEYCEIAL